jgi:plastocyanin domain-containing protein
MTGMELAILFAGITAIGWVNWYFFVAGRAPTAVTRSTTGPDEVTITVQGGYEPAIVRVRSGHPVRLIFDRQETSGCSEEIVIPDFGIRRFLPPFQRTAIEITPDHAGRFPFTCGMSMLHGAIIAE